MAKKKSLDEKIDASNRRFWSLSPQLQLAAAAKDAIAQVKANKFTPMSGYYTKFRGNADISSDQTSEEAQLALHSSDIVCHGCERGGLLISRARLGNAIDGDELYRGYGTSRTLNMPSDMIMVLESLFEGWDFDSMHGLSDEEMDALIDLKESLPEGDAEELFLAINENLAKNKGNLVFNGTNITKELWKDHVPTAPPEKYAKK